MVLVLVVACGGASAAQDKPAALPTPSATTQTATTSAAKEPEIHTTASGLQYIDERVGDGPSPASIDSTITAHYVGQSSDGTKFDSSYDRGRPIKITLRSLIKGWQEGVLTMRVGGQRRLIVPPELGYGTGAGPMYGWITFDIELLGVDDNP